MMNQEILTLIQTIDGKQTDLDRLDAYYSGNPPLAYLTPEARAALGNRFGHLGSNFCRLAVTSITERLRITGFSRDGEHDEQIWSDWARNNLDQSSATAHREALALGSAFIIVWGDKAGRPVVSLESAKQMAVARDPLTREIVLAVKKWETPTGTRLVSYGPEKITTYTSKSANATSLAQFEAADSVDNPLGVPPVVELANTDRLLSAGASELTDIAPLQDALNKLLSDMLVGSEYYARPRRYATGVELDEDMEDEDGNEVHPYPEDQRMLISEAADAKFGQLPAADLNSYETAIKVVLQQIQAVSSLPGHYVGALDSQPPSADGLRAAEASLTARVEQRQHTFGKAWEQVAALMHAIRTGTDPAAVEVSIKWADPATRSTAQEADAVTKLYAAGLLPVSVALEKLGYSAEDVARIRAARRAEALDNAGTDLDGLLAPPQREEAA